MFFDPFMVAVEQVPVYETVTIIIPVPTPTPPQQPQRGFLKKRQKQRYEYFFEQVTERKGFVGAEVLREGAYISANCLFFFMDPERKNPISLRFGSMLNLSWQINGEQEHITLNTAIESLDINESFQWVLYGLYRRPDNLGDTIDVLTIEVPDAIKGFLTCEINKAKPDKPLRDGDSFKMLFTIIKNSAYEEFKKSNSDTSFGISGHGYRVVDA
jgi:hypothetical protein